MEEAKDIRELKNLLSGLSLQDETKHPLRQRNDGGGEQCARKIVLLKSVSVFLFSLSLFLMLCLILLLVRVYLTGDSHQKTNQTKAVPLVPQEVPSGTEPATVVPDQHGSAPPAVHLSDRSEPAVSGKKDVITVELKKGGGSLYFIALKNYGKADETVFDLIVQANPAIVDVRKIHDHQHIMVPEITEESYIRETAEGGYRVHIGTFETAQWASIHAARVRNTEKRYLIEPRQFSSQDTWYRLTMGEFENKEEALKTVSSLALKGLIYIPPRLR